jgi:hypothetical protein
VFSLETTICAGIGNPALSIIVTEADVIPPVPRWVAKVTAAISPLPENALVLMMAVLMEPGLLVPDTIIAPATSAP